MEQIKYFCDRCHNEMRNPAGIQFHFFGTPSSMKITNKYFTRWASDNNKVHLCEECLARMGFLFEEPPREEKKYSVRDYSPEAIALLEALMNLGWANYQPPES